jgi:hypothetical protein
MKFGLYKTAIEKKLVNSFVNENLTKDMKKFKDLVLKSEETKTLFFIYDKLNENLGLDKESANVLVDEVIKETKDIIIPDNHIEKLNVWLKDELTESNYSHIDQILNGSIKKIEDRVESRKIVVENLMKEKQVKKETPKLPISSLKKIANSVASKYLSNLDESTQKEVISLLKENEEVLVTKFNEEKEQVISKLNSLIESETEEETKKKINETKDKVSSTNFSVNELIKIKELNSQLVL